jgi:cytochrome bd-type quinol oxidase subunit 1
MIDGIGILLHVLISCSLSGISLALIISALKFKAFFNTIFQLFVVVFSFSIISGIGLYSEFAYLKEPYGRSALLGYLFVNIIILIQWVIRPQNSTILAILGLILFLNSIILSSWSVIVNTIMQYPQDWILVNSKSEVLLNEIKISSILCNSEIFLRLTHNYLAFTVTGLCLSLIFILHKTNCFFKLRNKFILTIISLIFCLNIFIPLSGHYQLHTIASHNHHKLTSIIGNDSSFAVYMPALKTNNNKVWGLNVTNLYPNFLKDKFIKKNLSFDKYNKFDKSIFNFFHLMTFIWGLSNLILFVMFILVYNNYTKIKRIAMILYSLFMIAIISGWLVSELGRQPYLFYNYILNTQLPIEFLSLKVVNNIVLQIILFLLLNIILFTQNSKINEGN